MDCVERRHTGTRNRATTHPGCESQTSSDPTPPRRSKLRTPPIS